MEEWALRTRESQISRGPSPIRDAVEGEVEKATDFPSIPSPPHRCGKEALFSRVFPIPFHTGLERSFLRFCTEFLSLGSVSRAVSTFRIEWMTVEWSRPPK